MLTCYHDNKRNDENKLKLVTIVTDIKSEKVQITSRFYSSILKLRTQHNNSTLCYYTVVYCAPCLPQNETWRVYKPITTSSWHYDTSSVKQQNTKFSNPTTNVRPAFTKFPPLHSRHLLVTCPKATPSSQHIQHAPITILCSWLNKNSHKF